MRPGAFPSFRKRYGTIENDIVANGSSVLEFLITDTFDVDSFKGKKSLVVLQPGSLSSDDTVLGVVNIVIGCISVGFGILFFLQDRFCPLFVEHRVEVTDRFSITSADCITRLSNSIIRGEQKVLQKEDV